MRIKFVYIIVFFMCVSLLKLNIFSNPQQYDDECLSFLRRYKPLMPITPIPLSEIELKRITEQRLCIKSYPWPKGESIETVDANRMKVIRDEVNKTIELYRYRLPTIDEVKIKFDNREITKYQARILLQLSICNLDPELAMLYGDVLYLKNLQKEDNYQQLLESTENLIKEYNMIPTEIIIDDAEAYTYFSKASLCNHTILLNYIAKSEIGPNNRREGYALLNDFLGKKDMLVFSIDLCGDPSERMFSNIGVDLKKFNAEKRLQRQLKEIGLYNGAIDGFWDNNTQTTLENKVKEYQIALQNLGFYQGGIDGLPGEKMKEGLKNFKKLEGLSENTIIDESTIRAFNRSKEILSIAKSQMSLSDYLNSPDKTDEITTFQRDGDIYLIHTKSSEGIKVYVMESGGIKECLKGEDGIILMDTKTRDLVKKNSDAKISFIGVGSYSLKSNTYIKVQLGEHELTVTKNEMQSLLNGEKDTSIPTFDNFFNDQQNNRDYIVFRDAFAQGLGGNEPNGYYHKSRHHIAPLKFAIALKNRYPDRRFHLDDEMEIGRKNLTRLPIVEGANDIAAYINGDEQSDLMIKDYNVIANIKRELLTSGIEIIENTTNTEKPNVLVITGHKDQNFRNYISNLGTQGVMENKIVALISCYQKGDEAFNSNLIINKYKARAVFFYSEEINPVAVEAVLKEFCTIIQNAIQEKNPTVEDLLKASVNAAQKKETNTKLKEEILKLRNGIIQVSFLIRPVHCIYG